MPVLQAAGIVTFNAGKRNGTLEVSIVNGKMDKGTPLLEPLTDREADILACLADGLSNSEIAERLFLAVSTVKWYVNQLNQKLGTRNRDEIVERARLLDLLDKDHAERIPAKHNLPHQTTPFVGRNAELNQLCALLTDPNVRLLTILAPGGMGKTRLALEAAEQQLYNFENGIYFVPLQALSEPEHIISQIAENIGYQSHDGREPKQPVLNYLANKRMLLIFDNFEHVLEGATLLIEILQAAPDVRILTTSREKLNLSGEAIYSLRGMQFPNRQMSDALEYDAVKLLTQAAKRVKPDWNITETHLEDVVRLCQLTQGMPLGIVLAAAWLDVYSLGRICDEIEQSADILQTDMRDVPERLRSIRTVFEYSWHRLQPAEQDVFMKMSVFRGGGTPRAAEHITGANPRLLQALVNKALLTQNQSGRYDIHELLRQYAEAHLEASGEADAIRDVHLLYYADAMYEREAYMRGHRELEAIRDIAPDFENVRAAWRWALHQRHYAAIALMVETIGMFTFKGCRFLEADELYEEAIEQLEGKPDKLRMLAKLRVWQGFFLNVMGQLERTETTLRHYLPILRQYGDGREIGTCLYVLSAAIAGQGRSEEALPLITESLSVSSEVGDKWGMTFASSFLGGLTTELRHTERGYQYLIDAYALSNEIGNAGGMAAALMGLAVFAWREADWETCERHSQEALAVCREIGDLYGIGRSFGNMANLALVKGDFEKAERLAKESLEYAREVNLAAGIAKCFLTLSAIAEVKGHNLEAHRLAQEGYAYAQADDHWTIILDAKCRLSWTLCCQGVHDDAINYLLFALEKLLEVGGIPGLLDCVAAVAQVVASQDQFERAAELLGLVFQHPVQMQYLVKHPRLTELRHELQTELGEDVYNAAWERGKSLDLETVAQELLAEYGREATE